MSGSASLSATAARSARRTMPRARCSADTPADPLGRMKLVERREALVHRVDFALEPLDLRRDDAQRAVDLPGRGDIGAEVEQVVLDARAAQSRALAVGQRGDSDADRGIGFVDLADGRHPQARLADPAAVDQPGAAAVAGARVDLVELDQASAARSSRRSTRIRTTMTIATAWNSTRLRIQFCCCSPVTSLPEAMAITPRTRT